MTKDEADEEAERRVIKAAKRQIAAHDALVRQHRRHRAPAGRLRRLLSEAQLRDHGWPKEGLQLLCCNCNQGKARNGGVCPHHGKRVSDAA